MNATTASTRSEREPRRAMLEIRNLFKTFGGFDAVQDASLTIEAGKTTVLLGESGSGKTTILRCVAGLENVTKGEIFLDGQLIASSSRQQKPESRRIGMVFQNYALWPTMTAVQNVAFAGRRNQRGRALRKKRRDEAGSLLDAVGLGDKRDRYPGQLSGGQQQRVALARALAGDVQLLLMDEPLSALDQALREQLRLELRTQIARSGLSCLYVTHDQQEALAMADVLIVMKDGRIEEIGEPQQIFERPRTSFGANFLGAKNSATGVVSASAGDRFVGEVAGRLVEFCPSDWTPEIGEKVELRWRPEHTEVHESGALGAGNTWPAKVLSTGYLGNFWEVSVDVFGEHVRAWAHGHVTGDVTVSVPPEKILGYRNP